MVKPVLEGLIEFKAYSEKELDEMNIFELAEEFKSLSNKMEHAENKIDDLKNFFSDYNYIITY